MLLDLIGWLLATVGLIGLSFGCRRAGFADEAAEYLPACSLLQGAALLAWLGSQPMGAALARCALCCGLAAVCFGTFRGHIKWPARRGPAPSRATVDLSAPPQRSGS